jgi:hypothetical protein
MSTYIQYLKDTLGSNFLGLKIFQHVVEPYLDTMKKVLGDNFETYINNQKLRDVDGYQLSVISVLEYDTLSRDLGIDNFINSLDVVFKYEIDDLKMLGLGKASDGVNTAYFIVCDSDKLNQIREKYDLPKIDLHITLGFKWKDVYGLRKNQIIKEKSDFIQLLSDNFYNHHETFEFLKNISNFSADSELEIDPIKIGETSATFRIGKNLYFTVSLVDNEFRIVAEWFGKADIPILSNTIVKRKFKEL